MSLVLLATVLAATPHEPATVQGRASVTIVEAVEIHYADLADEGRLEPSNVRVEDGTSKPALLVEFL